MRRWIASHKKLLAIALVGAVQLAAYIVADPGELPDWVVTAAVVVNALAVWAAPRNATPITREDLARRVEYYKEPARERHTRRDPVEGPPRRDVRRHGQADPEDRPGTIP